MPAGDPLLCGFRGEYNACVVLLSAPREEVDRRLESLALDVMTAPQPIFDDERHPVLLMVGEQRAVRPLDSGSPICQFLANVAPLTYLEAMLLIPYMQRREGVARTRAGLATSTILYLDDRTAIAFGWFAGFEKKLEARKIVWSELVGRASVTIPPDVPGLDLQFEPRGQRLAPANVPTFEPIREIFRQSHWGELAGTPRLVDMDMDFEHDAARVRPVLAEGTVHEAFTPIIAGSFSVGDDLPSGHRAFLISAPWEMTPPRSPSDPPSGPEPGHTPTRGGWTQRPETPPLTTLRALQAGVPQLGLTLTGTFDATVVVHRAEPAAVEAALPAGLILGPPDLDGSGMHPVLTVLGRQRDVRVELLDEQLCQFLPEPFCMHYGEAIALVPFVRRAGGPAGAPDFNCSTRLYLDDPVPILLGWIVGFPKRLGTIEFENGSGHALEDGSPRFQVEFEAEQDPTTPDQIELFAPLRPLFEDAGHIGRLFAVNGIDLLQTFVCTNISFALDRGQTIQSGSASGHVHEAFLAAIEGPFTSPGIATDTFGAFRLRADWEMTALLECP